MENLQSLEKRCYKLNELTNEVSCTCAKLDVPANMHCGSKMQSKM